MCGLTCLAGAVARGRRGLALRRSSRRRPRTSSGLRRCALLRWREPTSPDTRSGSAPRQELCRSHPTLPCIVHELLVTVPKGALVPASFGRGAPSPAPGAFAAHSGGGISSGRATLLLSPLAWRPREFRSVLETAVSVKSFVEKPSSSPQGEVVQYTSLRIRVRGTHTRFRREPLSANHRLY